MMSKKSEQIINTKEEKPASIEEAFEHIQEALLKLESSDCSLEEAFDYYQKGMNQVKYCNELIDQVEKKVLLINGNGETDALS